MLPTLALIFFLPLMDVGWNVDTITTLSFVKMDTDSDGFISKSEMTDQWKSKYETTSRPLTKPEYESQVDSKPYDLNTKQLLKKLFEKMDKDKNGVLDSSDPEKFFDEMDVDGDGRISQDEYKRYTKLQMHKVPILTLGIKIKMLTTESFKKMDTNGDGLVSKTEIKDKLFGNDEDTDKQITKEKFESLVNVENGNDEDTDKQITKEKFESLVNVENVDPQTKMMVKNYFDGLDKDKNGILDGQDVDELFDEADLDKDDQISDHEYKRYIAKQLSRVPTVLFGMNVKILTNQSFRKTDSNGDGVVTKPEMLEKLQEKDQDMNGQVSKDEYERWVDGKHFDPSSRRIVKTYFDNIDRDKNGFLDEQDVDAIFDETDRDKDNQVTEDEYNRYFSKVMHQNPRVSHGMKVKILILHSFLKTDTNMDGYVSRQEIINKIHEKDVDRDGKVTRDEYRRSVDAKNLDKQTKKILKDHFDDMDKDKNGVLDSKDVDITLDQADTDNDGKISENEYKRYISKQLGCVGVYDSGMGKDSITPLFEFRAMDSNRDGLVSKPEMESKLINKDEDKNVEMTQDENDRWSQAQYLHPHTKTMFKNRLDSMEKNQYGTVDRSDIDSLFDEADLNRDSHISETEFERQARY
ncbi:uncharacterized protein LOC131947650 [Physella acuta]|uniref:uncharacterized protein LOC131947650 n=1 Tax=Physella acuta TaxID=109671 RepID=UPI0027DCD2FF|nr:uncharacterized protein LOC131947650 [Physella acuta]